MANETELYSKTPLLFSRHLSATLDASVYLKLENLQPCHSFKSRGISLFAQRAKERYGPSAHLVIASGGNAGLAAACAAHALDIKCTVCLPQGPSERILDFFRKEHANVVIIDSAFYVSAVAAAQRLVDEDEHAFMCPAYENSIIWEGHASMVSEIKHDLFGVVPDAIFCSVGGGGLIGGIMMGCRREGWDSVPIVAVETHGSDTFYQSLALNRGEYGAVENTSLVSDKLPKTVEGRWDEDHQVHYSNLINGPVSRATSLGASTPAPAVVKKALTREGGVRSVTVSDEMTMRTVLGLAEDHKMLVELACGAALSPAYNRALFDSIMPSTSEGSKKPTVVFVVCGGFKISLEELVEYEKCVEADTAESWKVRLDGKAFSLASHKVKRMAGRTIRPIV